MIKKRIHGFAMIEYLVISFMLVSVLFVGDPSLASQVVNGLKSYYKALTFIISLP
jgi:hypothetical protein